MADKQYKIVTLGQAIRFQQAIARAANFFCTYGYDPEIESGIGGCHIVLRLNGKKAISLKAIRQFDEVILSYDSSVTPREVAQVAGGAAFGAVSVMSLAAGQIQGAKFIDNSIELTVKAVKERKQINSSGAWACDVLAGALTGHEMPDPATYEKGKGASEESESPSDESAGNVASAPYAAPGTLQASTAPAAGALDNAVVMRFCGECGSPLSPQAQFCPECGAPVRNAVTANPAVAEDSTGTTVSTAPTASEAPSAPLALEDSVTAVTPAAPAIPSTETGAQPHKAFCPECGSPLKPGAAFCGVCGTRL